MKTNTISIFFLFALFMQISVFAQTVSDKSTKIDAPKPAASGKVEAADQNNSNVAPVKSAENVKPCCAAKNAEAGKANCAGKSEGKPCCKDKKAGCCQGQAKKANCESKASDEKKGGTEKAKDSAGKTTGSLQPVAGKGCCHK